MFRLASYVVIGILVGPVLAGLAYMILPAFGVAPFFGNSELSLRPLEKAFESPGFGTSVWLSFWMGPVTALISLIVVMLFTAAFSGTRIFAAFAGLMRPLLAVPHAAAAFGLAFLIAPSGFLIRLVSPELTGFTRPPDWLILMDPGGGAMLSGLVIKEIPFVLFVTLAALPQAGRARAEVAASFGYGRVWGWFTSIFPSVYRQIRLPIYAVIAFASSVVDVAIILGPGTPPPLSVRILRWMGDPDLTMRLTAAAAALIQLGVTFAALALWWLGEKAVAFAGCRLATTGVRFRLDWPARALGATGMGLTAALVLGGIFILGLWSLAGLWRFPDAMPESLGFDNWMDHAPALLETGMTATVIGTVASFIALVLVIACLENEYRRDYRLTLRAQLVLFLPLLVPQIAFLFGLSVLFLWLGFDGTVWAVAFAHLVFVLPYVYLTLVDPWHALDPRFLSAARALGKSPDAVLVGIRLPMLLRPILAAFALGFAVSIAQYLPTLLIGAGRQPTITTEAVALASGGNRRLIGAYGLVQTLLPFIAFAIAGLVPAVLWRNRRALRLGTA